MKSLDYIKHTAHTKSFYVSTTQYCSCVMQLPIWNNTILDSEKKSSPREQTEGKNRKNIKTVTMGNLKISSESRYSYEIKIKNTHTKDQFSFLNNFIRFLFLSTSIYRRWIYICMNFPLRSFSLYYNCGIFNYIFIISQTSEQVW